MCTRIIKSESMPKIKQIKKYDFTTCDKRDMSRLSHIVKLKPLSYRDKDTYAG